MTFLETEIKGCYKITYDKNEDSRGDFSRLLCRKDLLSIDIDFIVKQSSLANNKKKGTARGLHHQVEPHGENKLVACTSGAISLFVHELAYPNRTITIELDARKSSVDVVYVPRSCASGYITLLDNSQVLYYMDEYYYPDSQKVIYLAEIGKDSDIDIDNAIMSKKDSKSRTKK